MNNDARKAFGTLAINATTGGAIWATGIWWSTELSFVMSAVIGYGMSITGMIALFVLIVSAQREQERQQDEMIANNPEMAEAIRTIQNLNRKASA